ncbi:MAG: hypothetical protein RL096_448, partial [Actinomycetota bacterium]
QRGGVGHHHVVAGGGLRHARLLGLCDRVLLVAAWRALLAFALSFDDFIITNFNAGPETTFPKFVYTAAARGIPAEANVIGSAVFILAIAIVMTVQIRTSIKQKRLSK